MNRLVDAGLWLLALLARATQENRVYRANAERDYHKHLGRWIEDTVAADVNPSTPYDWESPTAQAVDRLFKVSAR